ncbi:MAG TPA: DUF4124 domain-containing protein [Burkholderiales bacterium]
MTLGKIAACLGAFGLLLACGTAQAQLYHYKDASGRMVYSDTPPPPGIPAGNILKAPKTTQAAPAPAAAAPADGKDKDGKEKKDGPKSVADREADYKKRMAESDKKGKEEAAKQKQAADNQARCASLQQNLAALQSGQRMKKFDDKGNPYFADDAERSADIAKAQQDMSGSKCGG